MIPHYRFFHHLLILIGLSLLVAACSSVAPTSPTGSATAQPTLLPGVTTTPSTEPEAPLGPTATPTETSTQPVEPTAAPTQSAAPTIPVASLTPLPPTEVAPAGSPTFTPIPQSAPSPTPAHPDFPPTIALEPVFTGFQSPVYLTHAGEEARLFIVEKSGRIYLVEDNVVPPTPFLDITDRVGSGASEQGLLSVAFPRDFAATGHFYVNYTDQVGDTVIARYQVLTGDDRQADPRSEQVILQIEQPAANHNGGQLQFGPDGYLYIGTGDGGRAGDPWGNAQNPGVLLGKMLRIDVAETSTYAVPTSNPFTSQPGARPEIWATGLRNPWRFSFDRATGDLYIADVGQNQYEEVSAQPAANSGGENYGWDVMEASHCFEPQTNCDSSGLVLPVAEYDHSQGCSITGGYIYRGTQYPQMTGVYFFGDFCSGNIWGLRREATGEWKMALLLNAPIGISSFGEDSTGELYVLDYRNGTIYHLTAAP